MTTQHTISLKTLVCAAIVTAASLGGAATARAERTGLTASSAHLTGTDYDPFMIHTWPKMQAGSTVSSQ